MGFPHAGDRRLNADIQVLRGVAILMVLVEHTQMNLFHWRSSLEVFIATYWRGAPGVDLFFVISGYVIARSLVPKLLPVANPAQYLAETLTFLLHRFWRLQPAAWLWLAIPLVLTGVFNRSGAFFHFDGNLPGALAGALAITNLRNSVIPFGAGAPQLFSPYWSLSFEEQFYWALPVAIYLLRARLHLLLLLCFAMQFAFPTFVLHCAQLRPGAIALGVLLALWERKPYYRAAEPRILAGSAGLRCAFVLGAVWLMGTTLGAVSDPEATVPFGVQSILCGALVYAATFDRGYIMRRGRLRTFVMWVGARSYSIYLVHMAAFATVREMVFRTTQPVWVHSYTDAAVLLVCGWGLAAVLAELTFRFVETPCRTYGRGLRIRAEEGVVAAVSG